MPSANTPGRAVGWGMQGGRSHRCWSSNCNARACETPFDPLKVKSPGAWVESAWLLGNHRKPRGRLKKPKAEIVYEVPADESSTSSEEEPVVYVKRRKPRKAKPTPKPKKAPRLVYVTDSSDEEEIYEEEEHYHEAPPQMSNWYNFV